MFHESSFSSDQPVSKKEDDSLNRAPFAARVAKILATVTSGDSLVVGVHGPWGDGKTSVLNLVRVELSANPDVIVRDFNPWRMASEDQMLRGFLSMLASSIGESLSTRAERARQGIGKWVDKLRPIARVGELVGGPGKAAVEILDALSKVANTGDSVALEELRERLVTILASSRKRIIILIDDIDRLDKHETFTLFKLIKACASFPNVCYLLAFDDQAVSKMLGERFGNGDEKAGRAFLEKIIQVPLKLPTAIVEDLRQICFRSVQQAIDLAGITLAQDQANTFVSGFDRGVMHRLDTPRVAKLYGNALMFALPMLKGEVNLVDQLLLEALRTFFPSAYAVISANQSAFCGVERELGGRLEDPPRGVSLLSEVFEGMDLKDQEALKNLLVDLFPRLKNPYKRGGIYGSDWLTSWTERKRVCSPDYCSRYFSYAIPRGDISDSGIEALIQMASKEEDSKLFDAVMKHFESGRSVRLIARFRIIEGTIDPSAVPALCCTIAKLARLIPNPHLFFSPDGPPSQAGILISHLIRRLRSPEERLKLSRKVIAEADPVWFSAECLRWLYVTDDLDKDEHNTLDKDQRQLVESDLLIRIKAASNHGDTLFNPETRQEMDLLVEWAHLEGKTPVQEHLLNIFSKQPDQIARFLEAASGQSWSMETGVALPSRIEGTYFNRIGQLIDFDLLADLVRNHCTGDFENPQQYPNTTKPLDSQLAEQFMYLNQMRKKAAPSN